MNDTQANVKRVLSIDGGGFRGLTCLYVLKHLMKELAIKPEDGGEDVPLPRPCELFDLICGTSTGGLIAILLGRLGLSCEEAIEVYLELGKSIFDEQADAGNVWGNVLNRERFSSANFEKVLARVVEKHTGARDLPMWPTEKIPRGKTANFVEETVEYRSCPTFVTLIPQIRTPDVGAYRIRSYPRPREATDSASTGHTWTICEAARGTSADPMYLASLIIKKGDANYYFHDAGASGFNNPANIALDEAEHMFGKDAEIVLVSLGTDLRSLLPEAQPKSGAKKEIKDEDVENFAEKIQSRLGKSFKNIRNAHQIARRYAKRLIEVAADTEIMHSSVADRFYNNNRGANYFRFNPPQGLPVIELIDYPQQKAIEEIIRNWLSFQGRESMSKLVMKMELKAKKVHAEPTTLTNRSILQWLGHSLLKLEIEIGH